MNFLLLLSSPGKCLILVLLHSLQVAYWEPCKWVSKLRDMATTDNPLYLKIGELSNTCGHRGPRRLLSTCDFSRLSCKPPVLSSVNGFVAPVQVGSAWLL